MSPRVRPLLVIALLTAAGAAFALPPDRIDENRAADTSRDEAKSADSAKSDTAKPVEPPATSADESTAEAAPAAPARDAAKPARPAGKQRPAWPLPPELIS